MTCPWWRLEVHMHYGFLQIKRWLPVGLLCLADCQCWPGAPLHEFPLRRHGHALAGRALDIIVTLRGLERQVSIVVAVHGIWVTVADMFPVVPRHDTGRAVGAVTIQIVVGAPPATRAVLPFFALAPLATMFGGVVAMMVITPCSSSYHITFCAIHLGWSLEGVRLGEELLDRMNKVSDAARTLASLLSSGGGALVL